MIVYYIDKKGNIHAAQSQTIRGAQAVSIDSEHHVLSVFDDQTGAFKELADVKQYLSDVEKRLFSGSQVHNAIFVADKMEYHDPALRNFTEFSPIPFDEYPNGEFLFTVESLEPITFTQYGVYDPGDGAVNSRFYYDGGFVVAGKGSDLQNDIADFMPPQYVGANGEGSQFEIPIADYDNLAFFRYQRNKVTNEYTGECYLVAVPFSAISGDSQNPTNIMQVANVIDLSDKPNIKAAILAQM